MRKETAFCRVVHDSMERTLAVMALLFVSRAFRVEMVLARRAGNDLAFFGDAQAL
jgi:hypothetical protein